MSDITQYETGATRDSREGKLVFDKFLSPKVLLQYAKYMNMNRVQSDGNLRDGDNWQKGINREDYMESVFRHFFDFWMEHRGYATDEGIMAAMCGLLFNVMGYMHEYLKVHPIREFDTTEPTNEMLERLRKIDDDEDETPEECPMKPCEDCLCEKDCLEQEWEAYKKKKKPEFKGICLGNYDKEDCRLCPDEHHCLEAFGPGDLILDGKKVVPETDKKIPNIVGCSCGQCDGNSAR